MENKPGGDDSDEVESADGNEETPDDNSSVNGFTTPPGSEAAESESVVQLKLQLALIQAQQDARIAEIQAKRKELETEKEKLAMQVTSKAGSG